MLHAIARIFYPAALTGEVVGIRGVERGGLQTREFGKSGSFDTAVPGRHLSASRSLHQHQLVIP
jgi:hypothetical protein